MRKHNRQQFLGIALALIFLHAGCSRLNKNPSAQGRADELNLARFDSTVASPALRDSVRQNTLVAGMPYFVAAQVFAKGARREKEIPVPGLGSRQQLQEKDVRPRDLVGSNVEVYLDEYETSQGKLAIWYQAPDFYRQEVAAGDTLVVYWQDRAQRAVVACLQDPFHFSVREALRGLPAEQTLYGEIHHYDNPRRERSYWFTLTADADGMTFTLASMDFELYPIEMMEVNGAPVSSFRWK
jgi:hypothetical protein